ncbi:hypothetical protein SAMN04488020_105202 [Palleronia marisminoris]|uniref:Uncharacterized protein n=1 Tax=Palleronia marisminoris TaxID=315423 RepID=A0A1Y5SU46_9RHOB|nr:hypothetical protein [Palleronia marisminoris]SFG97927.1 hypothetical protein SAMN04488020_105202 [Palleronia marisminoris]SLN47901.1 hypothetical protein PAM7066_02146 [Palleronia marisminoris]
MLRLAVTILALVAASSAWAGGLCIGAECRDAGPVGQYAAPVDRLAPAPGVVTPPLSAARQTYEDLLTDLWKSEANGTCLGTLGAWHLTPYHIMAEATVFKIASITGTPARIGVLARRVSDKAEAQFTFVPRGRNRVDVSGQVLGVDDPYPDHYIAALRRCRRGME